MTDPYSAPNSRKLTYLIITLLLVLLVVLGLIWWLWPKSEPSKPTQANVAQTQATGTADYKGKYYFAGMPRTTTYPNPLQILTNLGYVVGYDNRRKDPAWVCYRLFKVNSLQAPPRPKEFQVDTRTSARVSSRDFSGSTYDRGHCAPNFAISVCYGQEAQLETFRLSNILGMKPNLNRQVWERLESQEIRTYAQDFGEIWVITGPVFADNPKKLKSGVEIPEACFKILVRQDKGQVVKAMAVIMPQTVTGNESLNTFTVSIDQIEDKTGLDFLSELEDVLENRLEAETAKELWK